METSSEENNIQDVPLTNILPTITGLVRSRSESLIDDDDSNSDFSFGDFGDIDDGDSDDNTDDLEIRSRRTNQRRVDPGWFLRMNREGDWKAWGPGWSLYVCVSVCVPGKSTYIYSG